MNIEPYTLRITGTMMSKLEGHLFPGDNDEHGAVIGASLVSTPRGTRLLARRLFIAEDGADYLPGVRGYKRLSPQFVQECVMQCAKERLVYIAIHCHGGSYEVSFSSSDIASHERGYPALVDILEGLPVIGLVLARNAAAGDIWLPNGERTSLTALRVIDRPIRTLYPSRKLALAADAIYHRQTLIFGDAGQEMLKNQKVGVIGAGGVGSLVVEYLARLGVGHILVIDPERIEDSNLSRIVGSTRWQAHAWMSKASQPSYIRKLSCILARAKVKIARSVAKRSNPNIKFDAILGDITGPSNAQNFTDCDYLFLAADSMQARLVFNALVHQYLIPGTQIGTKVSVDNGTHEILDVYSAARAITPDRGCLWCNGIISSFKLNEEAKTNEQRKQQKYLDDEEVKSPSVITLNAVATSHAVDDYMFSLMGLLHASQDFPWLRFHPLPARPSERIYFEMPHKDLGCPECSITGRLARGDSTRLPTKIS